MPAVDLLDDFHSNPKVLSAGNEATGLYARSLSYCGCYLTDGFIPGEWAVAAGSKKLANALVKAGLWEAVDGGYRIPDFLDFNLSKAQVIERSEAARAAGKKGGKKRWHGRRHSGSHSQPHSEPYSQGHSPPHNGTMADTTPDPSPDLDTNARARTPSPSPAPSEGSTESERSAVQPETHYDADALVQTTADAWDEIPF